MLNAELWCRLCRRFESFAEQIPLFCILHFHAVQKKGCLSFNCAIVFLSYVHFSFLGNKKAPASPTGNKDRISCLCHLAACSCFCRCQHIRCPITGANRQKILGILPFPLPSAVHLLLRFSPHFHQRGLSADALSALSPRHRFAYLMKLLNTISYGLSSPFCAGDGRNEN